MSSKNIVRLIFGLGFFVILLMSGKDYQKYRATLAENKPVKYTVANVYYKVSRGRSYFMDVVFEGRPYKVSITENIAHGIAADKYPAVYYVKENDVLITAWSAVFCRRLIILSLVVILICSIPFERIFPKKKQIKR